MPLLFTLGLASGRCSAFPSNLLRIAIPTSLNVVARVVASSASPRPPLPCPDRPVLGLVTKCVHPSFIFAIHASPSAGLFHSSFTFASCASGPAAPTARSLGSSRSYAQRPDGIDDRRASESPAVSDWQILQFSHLPNRRTLTIGYNGAAIRDYTMDLIVLLLCILVGGGSGGGGH